MSIVKCPACGAAIQVAEKKTGLWWGVGCLLMAVAIPFIVAIIGLLAAIAIPSFVKARETTQRNLCVANLRQLDAAKEEAAVRHNRREGDEIPAQELSALLKNGAGGLVCPKGGPYTINPVGQPPACSVHGSLHGAGAHAARPPHRGAAAGGVEAGEQP